MPVPDNFTFSLTDVKDEIETDDTAIVTSLADAFSDSNEFGFDDTHDDVSGANTQSLREFRNYDHSATDPGGGGNGGSSIQMFFTVTSFAQGGTSGETTYTLGTVEVPNNSSTTPWTITWTPDWVGLKVGTGLGAFDYDGSVSGTGDAVQIFASVENNGENSDFDREVTFTITGGDTHTITQSGPSGEPP